MADSAIINLLRKNVGAGLARRSLFLSKVPCRQYQLHQIQTRRSFIKWIMYSAKKGVERDWVAFVQQPIDFSPEAIRQWISKKEWVQIKESQRYIAKRHEVLGPNLAAAHLIVGSGGAVKFANSQRWIEKDKDGKYTLPNRWIPSFQLEAVDASNTNFMYDTFENLFRLKHLQYLNVSGCKHFDDWCMDRLQTIKDSLVCLDVSGCPNVTERGLAALHKINLQCLRASDMPKVEDPGITGMMLEEMMPNCKIEGLAEGLRDINDRTV